MSTVPTSAPDEEQAFAEQSQPLNIHFHFALSSNTPEDDEDYLRNRLLPSTAAVLKQFIQVRHPPDTGVLRITPPCEDGWKICNDGECTLQCKTWGDRMCGHIPFPVQHLDTLYTCEGTVGDADCSSSSPGIGVEADLIIYVTNGMATCEGDSLASSVSCASDTLTNRPVAGSIDYCNFGRHRFQSDLMVSVHEMIHILGMSARFFNVSSAVNGEAKFIDKELNPMKISDVVQPFESALGRTRYRVVTPAVRAVVRRHFACPTLPGALLEDDLGHGSAGSHWDQRLFQGEMMDPVAGEDTVVGRHVLTNVTLALLEDTGWYGVDYRASGFNHWGYQAGCEFAERPVKDVIASEDTAVQRFTCQRELAASTECTVDLTSLGVCTTDSSFDGLSHVQEESPEQACLRSEISSYDESQADYGQYHGLGSRCILQSPGFSREGFDIVSSRPSAGCYKTLCKGEGADRQLYVEFEGSGVQVACPSGALIDLSSIEGLDFTVKSLLGPCPDKEVLCGVGQADEGLRECGDTDCSAAGECLRGRCHCHVGYVGEHCGLRVCTNDEECGVGKVCHWSGQCLTAQQAQELEFQAITPIVAEDGAGGSSGGLSDATKLVIMLSMGTLLLVIAVVCAWLLLRNRRGRPERAVRTSAHGSRRNRQSRRSAQRMTEFGVSPTSTPVHSAPGSGSSQAKCSPSQSRKALATHAGCEEAHRQSAHAWPVAVDPSGCPMSM